MKKHTKAVFLFLIATFFGFNSGFSQDNNTVVAESVQAENRKAETNRLMSLLNKLEGTYQIQVIDSREQPTIPLTLMETIELNRHTTEVKYIWLKSNMRVKILSKNEINTSSFIGIPRVINISASDLK